jgi:hypothetical protein
MIDFACTRASDVADAARGCPHKPGKIVLVPAG